MDDILLEAISEILEIDLNVLELLNIEIGEDFGSSSDQWHYGYYFTFPQIDNIDKEVLEEIKGYPCFANIPFGETKYFTDGQLSSTKADPFGYQADYQEELFYLNHPVSKKGVLDALSKIETQVSDNDDEIVKKSLIISAFSIIEGFKRNFVWDLVIKDNVDNIGEANKKLFTKMIFDKLANYNGRNYIYEELTGNKLKKIPMFEIRNKLAHDISSCILTDNCIMYFDKENSRKEFEINNLFIQLKQYVEQNFN